MPVHTIESSGWCLVGLLVRPWLAALGASTLRNASLFSVGNMSERSMGLGCSFLKLSRYCWCLLPTITSKYSIVVLWAQERLHLLRKQVGCSLPGGDSIATTPCSTTHGDDEHISQKGCLLGLSRGKDPPHGANGYFVGGDIWFWV